MITNSIPINEEDQLFQQPNNVQSYYPLGNGLWEGGFWPHVPRKLSSLMMVGQRYHSSGGYNNRSEKPVWGANPNQRISTNENSRDATKAETEAFVKSTKRFHHHPDFQNQILIEGQKIIHQCKVKNPSGFISKWMTNFPGLDIEKKVIISYIGMLGMYYLQTDLQDYERKNMEDAKNNLMKALRIISTRRRWRRRDDRYYQTELFQFINLYK